MDCLRSLIRAVLRPFAPAPRYHPIVQELADWVAASRTRTTDFDDAIRTATSQNIRELSHIRVFSDYLQFLSDTLTWLPCETVTATTIYNRFGAYYFILSQPSIYHYQTPLDHKGAHDDSPTFLSAWIVRYGRGVGAWLDTPASMTPDTLATFRECPAFNLEEYVQPPGGWRCFNDFFARHFKPGLRPVANITDGQRFVAPADFTYIGHMPVTNEATVVVKGLPWRLHELLAGSPLAERFSDGVCLHGFLGIHDYHRLHAPVAGRVVESRRVLGQLHLMVETEEVDDDAPGHTATTEGTVSEKILCKRRIFNYPNEIGYQFAQSRGVVLLETAMGLVAVVPVGMAVVGSVVLTAEVGAELRKGEEMGYFQFGGSDMIMFFEKGIEITAAPGQHYRMGMEIGRHGGSGAPQ